MLMSRRRVPVTSPAILFLAFCGAAVVLAAAQTADPQEEAQHQALRDVRALYERAIRENRLDLLTPHVHSDFHGVMVTGQMVDSTTDVQKYWQDIRRLIGEGGSYTTTLKPERSVIVNDIALARGTTDDVVVTGEGQEFRFQSMWTAVLQQEDGRWKIRRMQGTIDPIGNPFVREFARRGATQAALWSFIVGAAMGVLLMGLFHRMRMRRHASRR